jgi:hypothetical protein
MNNSDIHSSSQVRHGHMQSQGAFASSVTWGRMRGETNSPAEWAAPRASAAAVNESAAPAARISHLAADSTTDVAGQGSSAASGMMQAHLMRIADQGRRAMSVARELQYLGHVTRKALDAATPAHRLASLGL